MAGLQTSESANVQPRFQSQCVFARFYWFGQGGESGVGGSAENTRTHFSLKFKKELYAKIFVRRECAGHTRLYFSDQ